MDFSSSQVDLIQELAEYLAKGAGVYSVEDSKNQILSVTVSTIEKPDSDIPEQHSYIVSTNYVKTDESRGTVDYVMVPGRVALLEFQPLVIEEGESIEDKLKEVAQDLKHRGASINSDTTSIWANNLVSYLSLGAGNHAPNFMDSSMGMTSVRVQWYFHPDTHVLYNFGGSEQIVYLCQVIYETHEPVKTVGSILFRVVPQ